MVVHGAVGDLRNLWVSAAADGSPAGAVLEGEGQSVEIFRWRKGIPPWAGRILPALVEVRSIHRSCWGNFPRERRDPLSRFAPGLYH